jgi:hypothetical protein
MFEAEKWAPWHKKSEHVTVMCCGNAFVNHKLKLVAFRNTKEPQSFKGTPQQTQLLSILTTRKGHGWIGRHWKLDPQVFCSKKFGSSSIRQNYHRKQLLLDNAPSHPSDSTLMSNNSLIIVKFLPHVTAIIRPMDQKVIASMEWHYQADLLRSLPEEDGNITTFCGKQKCSVLCIVYLRHGLPLIQ